MVKKKPLPPRHFLQIFPRHRKWSHRYQERHLIRHQILKMVKSEKKVKSAIRKKPPPLQDQPPRLQNFGGSNHPRRTALLPNPSLLLQYSSQTLRLASILLLCPQNPPPTNKTFSTPRHRFSRTHLFSKHPHIDLT